MKNRKLFTCYAARWFDSLNGNTYHSVRIVRHCNGQQIAQGETYGYGRHFEQTALKLMLERKWISNVAYNKGNVYSYERENNYPINWFVSDGLKRDMKRNAEI